jgi:NADPH:quinone reductase-like Zn-dependent oxidoreductase
MTETRARAVRFDQYGGLDVLHVADVPMPEPGEGEVVVAVRAAGINPGEAAIRAGQMHAMYPATFPSGQGSELAGVVTEVGEGVTEFAVGDEVLGFSFTRSSHATHTAVPTSQLVAKPPQLSWQVAGALYMPCCTAYAAVRAVAPRPGETVAVSAAAGGVGSVVVQLLAAQGVKVLGIASARSTDWLAAHGATTVPYGDGLRERLADAAPEGVDAFIDLFGPEYLDLAIDLGVPPERIETIISFARAQELGTKADGSGTASTKEVLAEMTARVAAGEIEIPIAATYRLDEVAEAFAELEQRHTHGKIVLIP